ncbi:hypothetical protein BH09DEP1_BH09DEP1_6950 [soil metagenome]
MIYICGLLILFSGISASEAPNRYKIEKQSLDPCMPLTQEEKESSHSLVEICKWAIVEYPSSDDFFFTYSMRLQFAHIHNLPIDFQSHHDRKNENKK